MVSGDGEAAPRSSEDEEEEAVRSAWSRAAAMIWRKRFCSESKLWIRIELEGLVEGEEPPDAQPSGSDDAVYEGNAVLIRLAPVPVLCCLSRSPEACMSMARASAASTQNGPAAATAAAAE